MAYCVCSGGHLCFGRQEYRLPLCTCLRSSQEIIARVAACLAFPLFLVCWLEE